MISHPAWGLSCYPASIFSTAPGELVSKCIDDIRNEQEKLELDIYCAGEKNS